MKAKIPHNHSEIAIARQKENEDKMHPHKIATNSDARKGRMDIKIYNSEEWKLLWEPVRATSNLIYQSSLTKNKKIGFKLSSDPVRATLIGSVAGL